MKHETDSKLATARWKPGPIAWIVLGLLLWGGYLAIGSYANGRTLHMQRGLLVFGVTVVFVGFWLVMLALRKRRIDRASGEREA